MARIWTKQVNSTAEHRTSGRDLAPVARVMEMVRNRKWGNNFVAACAANGNYNFTFWTRCLQSAPCQCSMANAWNRSDSTAMKQHKWTSVCNRCAWRGWIIASIRLVQAHVQHRNRQGSVQKQNTIDRRVEGSDNIYMCRLPRLWVHTQTHYRNLRVAEL